MKPYTIEVTRSAEKDIIKTLDYITYVLMNPDAAGDLLDKTGKTIESLQAYPERFPLVDDAVLRGLGIRFIVVNNYLVFYMIDEEKHCVNVIRFIYNKRDWITMLNQTVDDNLVELE